MLDGKEDTVSIKNMAFVPEEQDLTREFVQEIFQDKIINKYYLKYWSGVKQFMRSGMLRNQNVQGSIGE